MSSGRWHENGSRKSKPASEKGVNKQRFVAAKGWRVLTICLSVQACVPGKKRVNRWGYVRKSHLKLLEGPLLSRVWPANRVVVGMRVAKWVREHLVDHTGQLYCLRACPVMLDIDTTYGAVRAGCAGALLLLNLHQHIPEGFKRPHLLEHLFRHLTVSPQGNRD